MPQTLTVTCNGELGTMIRITGKPDKETDAFHDATVIQTKGGGFVITCNSGENELMISLAPMYGSTNMCDLVDIALIYTRILAPHRLRRMTCKLDEVDHTLNLLIANVL